MKCCLISSERDQRIMADLMGLVREDCDNADQLEQTLARLVHQEDVAIILIGSKLAAALRRTKPEVLRDYESLENPLVFALPESGDFRGALAGIHLE